LLEDGDVAKFSGDKENYYYACRNDVFRSSAMSPK
jgi:hypothetical protein